MEFPEVFFHEGEGSSAAIADQLLRWGFERPLVVCSQHGKALTADLASKLSIEEPPHGADRRWAAQVGSKAHRAEVDSVIAVGGGRCLDLAKLVAARAGVGVVTIPTQLSHDGIASPVAVVPGLDGKPESIGAVTPRGVFVSLDELAHAPLTATRAGVGDLLANPLALRDWKLASERGLDAIDTRAWDLSVKAYDDVRILLDENIEMHDPAFIRPLAEALIGSGLAMIAAGTSRPASGGEHEISHAIDQLFGGRALHGAQVAFGCIITLALYGDEVTDYRRLLARLELPQHPDDLGLSADQLVEVILTAPDTRPGRYTILEHADLDDAGARALVESIF